MVKALDGAWKVTSLPGNVFFAFLVEGEGCGKDETEPYRFSGTREGEERSYTDRDVFRYGVAGNKQR